MMIQDNVIKEYLKNVYFITGNPCAGKTSVSKALSEKYSVRRYDIDEMFPAHRSVSDPAFQPAMNRTFRDADEFFGRSVAEYREWLLKNTREQLEYVILDLVRLSENSKILCDCHLTLEQAAMLTEPARIAFILKWPEGIVDEYCAREDHKGFSDYIHSAADFGKAKAVCGETLFSLNEGHYKAVKNSGYFWLERDDSRSVEETADLVARHFGIR